LLDIFAIGASEERSEVAGLENRCRAHLRCPQVS
jgi:hypothetical protein